MRMVIECARFTARGLEITIKKPFQGKNQEPTPELKRLLRIVCHYFRTSEYQVNSSGIILCVSDQLGRDITTKVQQLSNDRLMQRLNTQVKFCNSDGTSLKLPGRLRISKSVNLFCVVKADVPFTSYDAQQLRNMVDAEIVGPDREHGALSFVVKIAEGDLIISTKRFLASIRSKILKEFK